MTDTILNANEIKIEFLDSVWDAHDATPTFEACLNAHGMYETMRFVLRLSPRNHQLMEQLEASDFESNSVSSDVMQAYSTYIHETVHWWQHVGSTSGLLLSLSYLAQCHSSMGELRNVLETFGAKKPLKAYTDQVLFKEGHAAQAKLSAANIAVNNALDVEYYKTYALSPRENAKWMIEQKHFESVGHGYIIVYGQLIGMLADTIDEEYVALPNMKRWDTEHMRLNTEKAEGFYHGSPVSLPAVGMRAIFEGQARFIQLQFLDRGSEQSMSCKDLRDQGVLFGIYVEAFETFLKLTDSDWPDRLDGPLVALFLLICDLAINPTRGIPFDVETFEDFILDVDSGVRFTRLCYAVKELSHLKNMIKDYSKEEYVAVSGELTQYAGYDHPMAGLKAISEWLETAPGLAKLMDEYKTFEYSQTNLPIRVFLSHFVAFCEDKLKRPEFFCWAGIYMSDQREMKGAREIWLRHLSLFSDRGDKDGVYPRKWPNRSEKNVKETFERFYGTMALYDLTRQWLLKDGPFVCDFRWLSENYDQSQAEEWGNNSFKQVFGVTLDEFEIVQ